jgi:hypothetical protein
MEQEPSSLAMELDDRKHHFAESRCGDRGIMSRNYPKYSSFEGITAVPFSPLSLMPIKKLTHLILISWSRWLLQSKLHRKEVRRKKGSV